MNPKISLVLFNYCQEKYLPDSLNSIFSQTDPPDELIIFDDVSTDNSIEVIKKIPNARFQFNESNQGIVANISKAIEIANHDYIALMAADDILHPQFIEEHRKLFVQQPNIGLSCSDCVFFEDKLPRRYEIYKFLGINESRIYSPDEAVALFRKTGFTVLSFTCIYNRLVLQKYGGYQPALKSLGDYYLNTQIALKYPIGYVPKTLAAARLVQNSYGDALRKNRVERMKIYARLFELVYQEEPPEFRKAFIKARLMSFGGLFLFYYIFWNPKYWFCLPSLLLKNWKLNLYKIYCILLGKSFPKLPVKPIIAAWP